MKTFATVEDAGLIVVRNGIDKVLVTDLFTELLETIPAHSHDLTYVTSSGEMGHDWRETGERPATQRLLEILNFYPEAVTVNYQPPRTSQRFHKDNPVVDDTVIIVHATDGGAFDYAPDATGPEAANLDYQTIELNAGDIVFQSKPYMYHRGRNLTDHPRITVALAEPIEEAWAEGR